MQQIVLHLPPCRTEFCVIVYKEGTFRYVLCASDHWEFKNGLEVPEIHMYHSINNFIQRGWLISTIP
jgi:hypothetical protein